MSVLTLRCQSEKGRVVLNGLTSSSTLSDLQEAIHLSTEIIAELQKLKSGFPPKAVPLENKAILITDLGIRNGDTILVERSANTQPKGLLEGRGMERKVVPSDNSCLFASLSNNLLGDVGSGNTQELRCAVANEIFSNPLEYPEVMLGKNPEDYAAWIIRDDVWGGGIELAILSKYFQTEIHVVDTQSLRIDKFGQDNSYNEKTFIIYDGIHYDPLYQPNVKGPITVFPVRDIEVEDAAMLLASNAKKAHNYTDLANFTLKCGVCGVGLRGEGDARCHAKSSGHTNFQEFS